jgi:hypothetical protein
MRAAPIIISFFLFVSCNTNSNWTSIPSKGLGQDETYKEIHLVDEQTGYIGGRHLTLLGRSHDTINFQNSAVLYKTSDQGKNWKQITLPFSGSVEKIISFGDTLILQIQSDTDTTLLVQSNNNGKDWNNLLTFTNHAWIVDIEFTTSLKGRLLTTDRQNDYLVKYENNCFDTVIKFPDSSSWAILGDNVISFKNVPSTADYGGYTLTDIKKRTTKELQFDKSYSIASHYKYNDNLYLAARKNHVGYILKLNAEGFEKIELGKYSKYQPNEVFAYGDKLIAIGNKQDEVGFLGVIHSSLTSSDGGKTWNKEDLPSPMCIDPSAIYKDKFFISKACHKGFQIRQW